MSKTIIAFGEVLWDLLPDRSVLGGAVFNCSYRLSTLGDEALFVSRLGADDLGRQALEQARQLGLITALMQVDERHPTGTVQVSLQQGIPDFFIVPNVAYDFIEPTAQLLQAASQADALVFGVLIQRNSRSRATLQAVVKAMPSAVKFLDINLRKNCYSEETVRWSLETADILKLNDQEAVELTRLLDLPTMSLPQFAEFMLATYRLKEVVITLGGKGVFALSAAGERCYVPGYRVRVADTVGAGDACAAGFLHALLHGESLKSACELGNALGALAATTHGATEKILPEQIEALLRTGGKRISSMYL